MPDTPDQEAVANLTAQLSVYSLSTTTTGSQSQQLTFSLLQPLASPSILETDHEILNTEPLSTAWREKLKAFVFPPGPLVFKFDLSLPKDEPAVGMDGAMETRPAFQSVRWDTFMPREGGLGLDSASVINLVRTLATTARVRCKDRDAEFRLVVPEHEGLAKRVSAPMEAHLDTLATSAKGGSLYSV